MKLEPAYLSADLVMPKCTHCGASLLARPIKRVVWEQILANFQSRPTCPRCGRTQSTKKN